MPEEQVAEGLHRAGAAAARVRPLQEALREIPGVQSGELHHLDQVCRAGDHPGRHGESPRHLRARHRTAATGHARGIDDGLIHQILQICLHIYKSTNAVSDF